jgi:hypothetical protein
MNKPTIYCFINSGDGTDWNIVLAVTADLECLASHCSSSKFWAQLDIGAREGGPHYKHRHAAYAERFPDGYEIEWVDDPLAHPVLGERIRQANKAAAEEPPARGKGE